MHTLCVVRSYSGLRRSCITEAKAEVSGHVIWPRMCICDARDFLLRACWPNHVPLTSALASVMQDLRNPLYRTITSHYVTAMNSQLVIKKANPLSKIWMFARHGGKTYCTMIAFSISSIVSMTRRESHSHSWENSPSLI